MLGFSSIERHRSRAGDHLGKSFLSQFERSFLFDIEQAVISRYTIYLVEITLPQACKINTLKVDLQCGSVSEKK